MGGDFFEISGENIYKLALINPDGSILKEFNPKPNDYIRRIQTLNDEQFYIIGRFTTVAGKKRYKIALINKDGTLNEDFNANSINKWIQVATNYKTENGSFWKTDLII